MGSWTEVFQFLVMMLGLALIVTGVVVAVKKFLD